MSAFSHGNYVLVPMRHERGASTTSMLARNTTPR